MSEPLGRVGILCMDHMYVVSLIAVILHASNVTLLSRGSMEVKRNYVINCQVVSMAASVVLVCMCVCVSESVHRLISCRFYPHLLSLAHTLVHLRHSQSVVYSHCKD
jgi:hypothetical protein